MELFYIFGFDFHQYNGFDRGKWGYKDDIKGIYIKPKYQSVQQFNNGYALVVDKKGQKGYINEQGKEFF